MKLTTLNLLLGLALMASSAQAAGDIEHPHERIEKVKAKDTTPHTEKSIMDRIHLKGDLRLRYESIERDDTPAEDNKYRYRLRIGAVVDLTDNLHAEVGMRSGFANPTSGNQTFEEDEPLKDYFFQSLRFNVLGLVYNSGNSTYKVGRQPYMMYRPIKSQLVWDNDVSLNGANYQYKNDTHIITVGANQPTLEEKSTANDTVNLFIAQYVNITKFESAQLNLGTGVYYYDGLKGNTALFVSRKGNTMYKDTNGNNRYANDYHMVEAFGELKFKDVFGKPVKVAAGLVYNFGASDNNFGYDLAIQVGKAKKINDWQVKYSYTDLQEDATYGAYSDSDNFGGGTASKGHAIRAKFKAGKNIYLAGNFFFNTLYQSRTKDLLVVEPTYERVQLDMIYKF
ncbi:MAG TPA: hypothetical protein EYO73_07980 [Sulfurimonas sp.]|nr:hypothetical protein [Sulfurimonas sp.]